MEKLHKITLKPEIEIEVEYEIRADTEERARLMAEAHIIKSLCVVFDADPKDVNIKFE